MLKNDVKQWVKYLIGERNCFKVTFANGVTETVEYKGYCWILNGKAYSDEELIEKMVRYQNNEKKYIVKFEEIEAETETEEVENLNDDLFQEDIERETNIKDNKIKKQKSINFLKAIVGKDVYIFERKENNVTKLLFNLDIFSEDVLNLVTLLIIRNKFELCSWNIEYIENNKCYILYFRRLMK